MAVDSEARVSNKILRWYDSQARDLPWRIPPGVALPSNDPNWPYRVWLSEIMLQQTTVAAVKPYFETFTARWPSVAALAAADDGDVMAAWAGLGYYARARNLLACARTLVADYGGLFPAQEAALRGLPGIGPYTAAALAAIAFGQRAVVVDGNVERVVARLFASRGDKVELKALAAGMTPETRSGDFAQAMMDLGATLCTPRSPSCLICPLCDDCAGKSMPAQFPAKSPKKQRPHRTGCCWWIERGGDVLVVRRDAKRMLGGMRALPSDDWDIKAQVSLQAFATEGGFVLGEITHIFTHFSLTLEIRRASLKTGCSLPEGAEWWPKARLDAAGLPSLFAKAARVALKGEE